MQTDILPFLSNDLSFDAETTHLMGEAFDLARRTMNDKGQPEIVLEIIAKRIIKIAQSGERDPVALAQRALSAIGVQPADL